MADIKLTEADAEMLKNAYEQCAWERDVLQAEVERLERVRKYLCKLKTIDVLREVEQTLESDKAERFIKTYIRKTLDRLMKEGAE